MKNEELKLANCRKSKNREDVTAILKKSKQPLSAEDIYKTLLKKKKTLALSTVYRILDKLLEHHIIHETMKDGDKTLYEISDNEHKHYMMCTECKKIIPLDLCPFREFENNITKETGFTITGHRFEIFGICPECNSKK